MAYMFGITRRVEVDNASVEDRLDALAKQIDQRLSFIRAHLPGEGFMGWFEGPNLGFPFDRDMERELRHAVTEAGLGWIWAP